MNLVEINEYLKGAPLQLLGQYANGKDPIIPAYMATGEIARREAMKQRMAVTQQAAQGKMPTVKEQVEQKAGLMSLQAQQQQQGQQRMMEQARAQPMPIPEQAPQPTEQAEETEMARGGIARLPVRGDMYDFARGGIIAFAGEGRSDVPAVEETEEEKKLRVMRELLSQGNNSISQNAQGLKSLASRPAEQGEKAATLQELMSGPATMRAAQQALNPQTIEEINAARLRSRELAGVKGEYGEEQRQRLAEEEAQYKEMLKDRGTNRLLAVLSGMGRGGLGGAAPAYLQTQAAEQAADIAQKRRLNQLRGDIDAKRRTEQMGEATGIAGEFSKQRGLAGESGTKYAIEAIGNQNAKDRLDIEYKNRLEEAKLRFANDQELRKIENDYAIKRDKINKDSQFALETFRQSGPTEEQKNYDAYLNRWKKNPENKDKQETEAFSQYWMDRQGGPYKEGRQDLIGLHNLQVSYAKQLEDLSLPKEKKAELRLKLDNVNKEIEARVRAGNANPSASKTGEPTVSNW
jgi:hypothetical protein